MEIVEVEKFLFDCWYPVSTITHYSDGTWRESGYKDGLVWNTRLQSHTAGTIYYNKLIEPPSAETLADWRQMEEERGTRKWNES